MLWHVGQKVLCADVKPNPRGGLCPLYYTTVLPELWGIYTIRAVFDAEPYGHHGESGLLLEEIVNLVLPYTAISGRSVKCEQFWLSFRFRPLHTTSIDVFTAMLEPVPAGRVLEPIQ